MRSLRFEALGTTAGIDGIDAAINYNGTEAVLNGNNSFFYIPDNDIFSPNDGVNDTPISIEFTINFNVGLVWPIDDGIWFVNKRDDTTFESEYQINWLDGVLGWTIFGDRGGVGDPVVGIRVEIATDLDPGLDLTIKCTYDGGLLASGLHIFFNDILMDTTIVNYQVYVGSDNTPSTVHVSKRGWNQSGFLEGTMKNLKFYDYAKES